MTNATKNKMYILGAGGFAREIYSYLKDSSFEYEDYILAGFLDDNRNSLDDFNLELQVLGPIRSSNLDVDDVVVMGVANCLIKKELFNFYSNRGVKIISYIHPTAIVGHDVIVGDGSVFGPYSLATTNVKIGKCATVNALSTLGHDVVLGDFCTLSGHCDITGGAQLSDEVFLGSGVTIIPQIIVESGAVIGAGSVVIKKVAAGSTVFGNPAKKIK